MHNFHVILVMQIYVSDVINIMLSIHDGSTVLCIGMQIETRHIYLYRHIRVA
jgi:hypothetical protein